MKQLLRYTGSISIVKVKPRYPQNDERMLIKAITGKSMPHGSISYTEGMVVLNAETVYNIGQLFMTGRPVSKKIVTVAGDAAGASVCCNVTIGTPVSWLVDKAGGFYVPPKVILKNGIMHGTDIIDKNDHVTATTNSISILYDIPDDAESECIRCNRCMQVCPMGLIPCVLNYYGKKNNVKMLRKHHARFCIKCGLCSYICPSKQDIVNNIVKEVYDE